MLYWLSEFPILDPRLLITVFHAWSPSLVVYFPASTLLYYSHLLSDDYVSSVSVFASSGSVSASTFGPVCSVSGSTVAETDISGVVSPFTGSFGKQVDGEVREGDGLRDGSGAVWGVGSVFN